MTYRKIQVAHFGGPEELKVVEKESRPIPGLGSVRIKVLAAGTGFTDSMIRRGKYPEYRGPLPFTPGYDLVGIVDAVSLGVDWPKIGDMVADLSVVGGYSQYAVRPARNLVSVPLGLDPAEAVCIPLTYVAAWQMLTRFRKFPRNATLLMVGASGAVGTAVLVLARHLGLKVIGTAPKSALQLVERLGATAIDYHDGDFAEKVMKLTNGKGVDAAFDAIGGAHWDRSFSCLVPGGLLIGFGMQGAVTGTESLLRSLIDFAELTILWNWFSFLFQGRRGAFYSITSRRKKYPAEYKEDMTQLFDLMKQGVIKPVIAERLPLSEAHTAHEHIDAEKVGGKIVLLPWAEAGEGPPLPAAVRKNPAAV
jgi:NADPH:quinone reductase-like Zn-dependent oxidoreductase